MRAADSIDLATIETRIGKDLDVMALKEASTDEIAAAADELRRTAESLYRGGDPLVEVVECPCCGAPTDDAAIEIRVYGVDYHRCRNCRHCFVRRQPTRAALERRFTEAEDLAETYIDTATLDVRLEQVVRPKLDWTLDVARTHLGRDPRSAIDVGAGGGHFVRMARDAGIDASGYEISESSRDFARRTLGVDLRRDFLGEQPRAELVTLWGLLEYTPDPRAFLRAARAAVEPDGLVVVEVPRVDCLGTAVQKTFPDRIARHLDPSSHVNCFSDASLAWALAGEGLRPVAAWYFGMDAYELAVQTALATGAALEGLVEVLAPLQHPLDEARFCDDVIVAALPA